MSELERALIALGQELELPRAPDVTGAVRSRIGRQARRRRLLLAAALAVVAALAIAFAVPSARSAILRFFHIRGAEVSLVDRLPRTNLRNALPGRPAALADAPFHVLLPAGERPDAVHLALGNSVWLRYGSPEQPRLLVTELVGGPWFVKKAVPPGTNVRYTSVGGKPALWIEGARHQLQLPGGGVRSAGNTLLWQHGSLTLRLEADVDLAHAEAIAASFR